MLRQATLDHPPYSPATALTALDAACSVLPMETSGTLVHARLDPVDGSPDWTLTWSNAGHPPPLLRTPDGQVTQLLEHDVLLHRSLGPFDRTEHRRPLLPGSTLLLYTDGLVERRGHDMDAAVAQLVALLARHGNHPLNPHLRTTSSCSPCELPQCRSNSVTETAGAAISATVVHMRFLFGRRSARAGRSRRGPRPTYGSWLSGAAAVLRITPDVEAARRAGADAPPGPGLSAQAGPCAGRCCPVPRLRGCGLGLGLEFQLAGDVLRTAVAPGFTRSGSWLPLPRSGPPSFVLTRAIAQERAGIEQDRKGSGPRFTAPRRLKALCDPDPSVERGWRGRRASEVVGLAQRGGYGAKNLVGGQGAGRLSAPRCAGSRERA
ncbi:PP2C family protein-serine/threonine phosphatase [Streptomyces xanthophaeus]